MGSGWHGGGSSPENRSPSRRTVVTGAGIKAGRRVPYLAFGVGGRWRCAAAATCCCCCCCCCSGEESADPEWKIDPPAGPLPVADPSGVRQLRAETSGRQGSRQVRWHQGFPPNSRRLGGLGRQPVHDHDLTTKSPMRCTHTRKQPHNFTAPLCRQHTRRRQLPATPSRNHAVARRQQHQQGSRGNLQQPAT